jgi:hypothetical protein
MFINEFSEPTLLVVYPGRFQPFHKGHHAVYEYLTGKFGRNNVYIATSNKTDNLKSPFTFAEKAYFMQLTGVPADRILQTASPYNPDSVTSAGAKVQDPANTVIIFAVSEKDMAEDPRFSSWTKKDGSPAYFQPLQNIKDTVAMGQHGYIMTVPTFDFTVAGAPMRSGTELRRLYAEADEPQRQLIIKDLFGRYTAEAEQLLTSKLAPQQPTNEPPQVPVKESTKKRDPLKVALLNKAKQAHPLASSDEEALYLYLNDREQNDFNHVEDEEHDLESRVSKLEKQFSQFGQVNECGGVGVVKDSNDPRYIMATMGDQNDVDGSTLNKEMKAYGLVGRKSPGSKGVK